MLLLVSDVTAPPFFLFHSSASDLLSARRQPALSYRLPSARICIEVQVGGACCSAPTLTPLDVLFPQISGADWGQAETTYNLYEVLFKVHKVRSMVSDDLSRCRHSKQKTTCWLSHPRFQILGQQLTQVMTADGEMGFCALCKFLRKKNLCCSQPLLLAHPFGNLFLFNIRNGFYTSPMLVTTTPVQCSLAFFLFPGEASFKRAANRGLKRDRFFLFSLFNIYSGLTIIKTTFNFTINTLSAICWNQFISWRTHFTRNSEIKILYSKK